MTPSKARPRARSSWTRSRAGLAARRLSGPEPVPAQRSTPRAPAPGPSDWTKATSPAPVRRAEVRAACASTWASCRRSTSRARRAGGSGCLPEAWDVRLRGLALPELLGCTIDEAYDLWGRCRGAGPAAGCCARRRAGLPGAAPAGLRALRRRGAAAQDRRRAARARRRRLRRCTSWTNRRSASTWRTSPVSLACWTAWSTAGHSVIVVEHHPHLLAACDWLVELGPGGGPEGGRLVASGTPETLARGATPTAPYLREILEAPA